MVLVNWLKVLRALQKAEEIKRNSDYCRKMMSKGACSCRIGELCQRALALATGLSDNAIKNMLLRLEAFRNELGEDFPFEIRKVEAGMNQPRKFIRLRESTVKIERKERTKPDEEFIKRLAKMSEDEIQEEFMNTEKYPTIDSIKEAVRGLVPSSVLSRVKRRETLIKHIIKAITSYDQFRL